MCRFIVLKNCSSPAVGGVQRTCNLALYGRKSVSRLPWFRQLCQSVQFLKRGCLQVVRSIGHIHKCKIIVDFGTKEPSLWGRATKGTVLLCHFIVFKVCLSPAVGGVQRTCGLAPYGQKPVSCLPQFRQLCEYVQFEKRRCLQVIRPIVYIHNCKIIVESGTKEPSPLLFHKYSV